MYVQKSVIMTQHAWTSALRQSILKYFLIFNQSRLLICSMGRFQNDIAESCKLEDTWSWISEQLHSQITTVHL